MAPATKKRDALIECEQTWECALQVRRDGVELSRKMAALLGYPCGGGMEPVVVARREVDDAVVEGGAAGRVVPGDSEGVGDLLLGGEEGGCRCVGWWGVRDRWGTGEETGEGVADAV